jgi:hypothetical protein
MQKATPDTSASNSSAEAATDRSLGVVRVSGKDRLELLQGQLTQDLDRLTPKLPLLAGWASPKGRLICAPWLLDWQDSVWMILPAALCASVTQRLTMFVLRSDVQVEVANDSVQPATRAQALTTIKFEDNDLSDCFYNDSYLFFEPVTGAGLMLGANAPEGNIDHWRLACIRGGIPTVWPETREAFVPQMLNLDLVDGISFSKGCYVGQEIVARTQNLGRIKRRMYAFHGPVTAHPQPGNPVYAKGSVVGEIVDAVNSDNGTELLAVVRIESATEALSLQPDGNDALEGADMPYRVPESS